MERGLRPVLAGTQTLNHALSAQSTAYVGLPATFAVTATLERRGTKRFARVRACMREGGEAVPAARITLWYGGPTLFSSRPVAIIRTDTRGCAAVRIRIATRMVLFASARVGIRSRAECAPSLARCSAATAYPPSGRFRLVRIRR